MTIELIKRHKWALLFATILSSISALFGISIMVMLNGEISNLKDGTIDDVAHGVMLFAAVVVGLGLFGILSQYILSKLSASFTEQLRDFMVKRVLDTSYENIERLGGHKIYATLTADINKLASGFSLLPHVTYNLSIVVFCLAYMAYSSWQLFTFVMFFLVASIVIAQLLLTRGMKLLQTLRETDDGLFKNYKSLVESGKELSINVNRKQYFYKNVVRPQIQDIRKKSVSTEFNFIILHNWTNVILFITMGSVVFLSQTLFTTIPVDVIVGFLLIIIFLVGPLSSLMDMYSVVASSFVAHKKVSSLNLSSVYGFSEKWSADADTKVATVKNWKCLSVRNLSYRYEPEGDEDYCFGVGPIDMEINQGEIIFLTGGNGSGKSTFIKTLVGLYTPSDGDMFLNNNKVELTKNGEWYRLHFSTIFSDFYLFDYVLDSKGKLADDVAIEEHLNKLKLDGKVSSTNGILSTLSLSHGQNKRLALLLSFLEDAAIYIFDEWAADQDPYFRKYFYNTLLPELKNKGKTVIAITHDDAYFHLADRLFKFENGMIVDTVVYEKEFQEVSE